MCETERGNALGGTGGYLEEFGGNERNIGHPLETDEQPFTVVVLGVKDPEETVPPFIIAPRIHPYHFHH